MPVVNVQLRGGSLAHALEAAASRSYCPYTLCPSGAVLRLSDGGSVAGSSIENAAYNPSITPAIYALDRLRFRQEAVRITRIDLGELPGGKVSQAGVTRLLAEVVAPEAQVAVTHLEGS